MGRSLARLRRATCSAASAALLLASTSAHGRARGIAVDSCSGCHGNPDAEPAEVSLRAEPAEISPGAAVTFTLEIRRPSLAVGGAFIASGNVGTLRAVAGSGLSQQGQGLAHSSPKAAVGGTVSFTFAWQAPSTPGVVHFSVAALAGNGNGATSGDTPAFGEFGWAYGCDAAPVYVDLDRDGYGAESLGMRLRCSGEPAPPGFADLDGDCDENDENAHPGAPEVCNKRDDDCDGEVDEGAEPAQQWPDGDGDGFYSMPRGTPKIGCNDVPGYASSGGDCDDLDPTIHPHATEVCNARDDDCNGDVDERVRPQCGFGWCSRYSPTCSALDCRPGEPREETCNAFDDDCDGELDNGTCGAPSVGGSAGVSGAAGAAGSGALLPSPPLVRSEEVRAPSGCTLAPGSEWSPAAWLLLALAVGRGRLRAGSAAPRLRVDDTSRR